MTKETNYTSDEMNFIKSLTDKNPAIIKKQDDLRKTWWDINEEQVKFDRELDKTNLKTDAYAYFSYE